MSEEQDWELSFAVHATRASAEHFYDRAEHAICDRQDEHECPITVGSIMPLDVDDDATEEDVVLALPEPRVKLSGTVRPVTGWIPFDPQNREANPLPEDGVEVFVAVADSVAFGMWRAADRDWQQGYYIFDTGAVTHWRPIEWPEPPT